MESALTASATLAVWAGALCAIGGGRAGAAAARQAISLSAVDALESLALALLAAVLTMESSAWWAPALAWLSWIVGEELWYRQVLRSRTPTRWFFPRSNSLPRSADSAAAPAAILETESVSDVELEEETLLPTGVEQQLTYTRTESDARQLQGLIRASFPAGQRYQVAHVAFCPPFERQPEVIGHVLEGAGAELRATHVACYGVRWEIQRPSSQSGQAADTVIYFEATEPRIDAGSETSSDADR